MGCTQAKVSGTKVSKMTLEMLEMKIPKLPKNKRINKSLFDISNPEVRKFLNAFNDLSNDGTVFPNQDELKNEAIASLNDRETIIFTIIVSKITKHTMLCPETFLFKKINEMGECKSKEALENINTLIDITSKLLKEI